MIRQLISSLREKVFRPPSLPDRPIGFILILILTQVGVLLMNQPLAYWQNAQYADPALTLDFLMVKGPWLFVAGSIIYFLITLLILKKLNIRYGFFLANIQFVFHSFVIFRATPHGPLPIIEPSTGTASLALRYGLVGLMALIYFGLVLIKPTERWNSWVRNAGIFLVVSWMALLGVGIFRSIKPPLSAWQSIAPALSPGMRSYAALAYDTKRQRAVLFGGVSRWVGDETVYDSSTWEWDGQNWHEIKTPIAPPGRFLHAMAYDEIRGKVILYGGQNNNGPLADFWAWDGENWEQLCPVCNPAGRYMHQMFYDPQREKIFIYGGYNEDKAFGEAWAWDGYSWNNFQFSTSAPALLNSPLVYDLANQRAVAYMKDPDWGGTWIWKDNVWSRLTFSVQPPLRGRATLVYEPTTGKSILFGGETEGHWFNDTWVFDGINWNELITPLAPSRRVASVAFFDPTRQSIILYGGENYNQIYGDMWELTLPGENK